MLSGKGGLVLNGYKKCSSPFATETVKCLWSIFLTTMFSRGKYAVSVSNKTVEFLIFMLNVENSLRCFMNAERKYFLHLGQM
jgi:hypothetical protein